MFRDAEVGRARERLRRRRRRRATDARASPAPCALSPPPLAQRRICSRMKRCAAGSSESPAYVSGIARPPRLFPARPSRRDYLVVPPPDCLSCRFALPFCLTLVLFPLARSRGRLFRDAAFACFAPPRSRRSADSLHVPSTHVRSRPGFGRRNSKFTGTAERRHKFPEHRRKKRRQRQSLPSSLK